MIALNNLAQFVARLGEVLDPGKAPGNNAKEVQCSYFSLSLHLHLSCQWPVGSCDISFDFTNACTNSPMIQIVLSENVKTTCAFPFILMPLTGARWRQRHIFHC